MLYQEGESRHGEFKKLIDRRELKPNGISTGNSRMAKLLLAKLVRDLWKMEFKDMEVNVGLRWIWERKIMETILKQPRPENRRTNSRNSLG